MQSLLESVGAPSPTALRQLPRLPRPLLFSKTIWLIIVVGESTPLKIDSYHHCGYQEISMESNILPLFHPLTFNLLGQAFYGTHHHPTSKRN